MNLLSSRAQHSRIRVILTVMLVIAGITLITQTAFAEYNIYSGTIPSTEVIEHDIIITGNNVVIDGVVKGNIFFSAGRTITINGTV